MAKHVKKKKAKGSSRQQMRRLLRSGQQFFLLRYRMLEILVVLIGAVIVVSVIVLVLFGDSPAKTVTAKPSAQLQTDTIDELELFIELRNTAYENPPTVRPEIFAR